MSNLISMSRELAELCFRNLNGGDNQLTGMEHGRAFRELRALLAQPADPVVSPGDEEFSYLSTIELRGYHKGWEAAIQRIADIYEAKRQSDAPKVKQ
ncbi:hypothetical protein [Pseudomonas protegens]|uniref:hypothetical protein n=1 Tax=Pseudomonas protegens TaxID=380021 RepID=UPI0022806F8D|nr:hypothetical protein [Pseudomonas protegens]MCY7262752.1 hypothetical protein [Pseudomonas protegens]